MHHRLGIFLISAWAVAACSQSSMSASSKSTSKGPGGLGDKNNGDSGDDNPTIFFDKLNSAISIPGDQNGDKVIDVEQPFDVTNGTVDISFDAGFDDRAKDTLSLRPLLVYFALDVTASMGPNIETIKKGIQSFVTKLTAKKFDVKVGYITFQDAVSQPSELMDAADLKSKLETINASGGFSSNEAALTAFQRALNFVTAKGAPDAIKAILTITDNPGHNEDIATDVGVKVDCSIERTLNAVNALAADQKNLVKIFHSVSDVKAGTSPGVTACGPFNSAKEQWNEILNKSLPDVPLARRGGALDYPFNGNVLEKDFVSLLEKTSPGADLICLVNQADLLINGNVIDSTKYDDLATLYKSHLDGTPFVWKNAVPESRLPELADNNKNQMHLKSCCLLKASAEAGQFGKCEEQKSITVNFKVNIN